MEEPLTSSEVWGVCWCQAPLSTSHFKGQKFHHHRLSFHSQKVPQIFRGQWSEMSCRLYDKAKMGTWCTVHFHVLFLVLFISISSAFHVVQYVHFRAHFVVQWQLCRLQVWEQSSHAEVLEHSWSLLLHVSHGQWYILSRWVSAWHGAVWKANHGIRESPCTNCFWKIMIFILKVNSLRSSLTFSVSLK